MMFIKQKIERLMLSWIASLLLISTTQAANYAEHPGVNQFGSIEKLERIPGGSFQWLKVDGKDYLVSENGRIAIMGNFTLMDVWSKTKINDISEMYKLNRLHLDKINLKINDLSTITIGKGRKEVTIFVDPNCSNCDSIYKQIPDLIDIYKVHLVVTPILSKESALYAKQLNCLIKSGKQKQAFDILVKKDFSNLSNQRCDSQAVRKTFLTSKVLGIRSVPFIIAPNGQTSKKANIDLLGFVKSNEKE